MIFYKPRKKSVNTVMYAKEKCDDFLEADTTEKGLISLQHCSQLAHILPSKRVRKIIKRAAENSDFRMKKEAHYLAIRWIQYFVARFGLVSRVLLLLCIIFLCVGLLFSWPSEVTLCISYILGALAVEVAFANIVLRIKQRVLRKWDLEILEKK